MEFEIDVSGEDLLEKDYTICIANKDNIIKGFKFNEELVQVLCSRYGQGLYKYKKSQKGKADFKVRIYSVILYYLIKSINVAEISLNICRDFQGREDDIRKNLIFFAEKILNVNLRERIYFVRLHPESNAHKYASLMRQDTKNKMGTYIKISLGEIEKWLK